MNIHESFGALATPRLPYDRKAGKDKPTGLMHVQVGGWAKVCVGTWAGDNQQIAFGYAIGIEDGTIYIRIADEIVSYEKTGIKDGDVIAVELEDLFGSEWAPEAVWWARFMQEEDARRNRCKSSEPTQWSLQ